MTKIGRHCYVSGKVQGVFYRQNTKQQALLRNITGWVQNLADGRVETQIFGEQEQIQSMLKWLAIGPPRAKVTDLTVTEIPVQSFKTFEIKK